MINRLANPLAVKQSPDAKILKTTTLSVPGEPLSTPPFAQEYFEPGINTKLNRRSKPKANYELPSDLPTFPLGFVPINQTPGAQGEEPAIIEVKQSVPADLLEVFAKISAEEKAMAAIPKFQVDVGSMLMREYKNALKEARIERKIDFMLDEGFTPAEVDKAMETVRMEQAIQTVREPTAPASVQTVLTETIPAAVPINERINIPFTATTGRSFRSSLQPIKERALGGRPTREQAEQKALEKALGEEARERKQEKITKFFGSN